MIKRNGSQWHSDDRYFGLHYDLHAGLGDSVLGKNVDSDTLMPMFELMNPEWVQTDCKGHGGYTSWFSQVPEASVSPGIVNDALLGWRKATSALNLPLHCHYSGIRDGAAAQKHPEWCMVDRDNQPLDPQYTGDEAWPANDIMSPHGDYLYKLMLPQLIELIDRYQVDGFWIDGEIWAVHADYGEKSKAKFIEETGHQSVPTDPDHPNWHRWMQFNRDSFARYVQIYCDAVHNHKQGVLVCSNWLHTFRHPGKPDIGTDWISGDNAWVWSIDGSRCEARFISTRGKRWDIMLWSFYKLGGTPRDEMIPWTMKPVQMLQQEAAITLAFGGAVQIYENGGYVRDGRIPLWRMKRLGEVGKFVKQRQSICQHTETIPQVAILHSETHYYAGATEPFPFFNNNSSPVEAATCALLENHYAVDIMDEWALLPRLSNFPLVVAPERNNMSQTMVNALKDYVVGGGCLLVTGSDAYERFGADFLGAASVAVENESVYHVAVEDGAVPIASAKWRLLEPTTGLPYGQLGTTSALDDYLIDYPAAVINAFGKGRVIFIPCDIFTWFHQVRYPMVRQFIGELLDHGLGKLQFRLFAPTGIDMVLRQKDQSIIIHLINLTSGLPNNPHAGAIDEIPCLTHIEIEVDLEDLPKHVKSAFDSVPIEWRYHNKLLQITLDHLHIHQAIVIEK
ncbi:MAG: alpha-L-fucosidase [Aggregatilineales bacterium]